jgi:C4-type Zn-finger protein
MAKMIQIESTSCPCCDTVLDAIEPIDGAPEFGTVPVSITICDCCGHLMMVEYDLTLREPTTAERREMANYPTLVAERRRWGS